MAPRLRLKHAQHKSADDASSIPASSSAAMSSRPRRAAAASVNEAAPSSVTVSRSNTPEARRRSIKLTVKLPSSKLREVTTDKHVKALQDTLEPGDYWKTDGQKRRRTQKSYVIPGPSDDDDEEQDEENDDDDDEEDDDDEGDEQDEPMNDFDEIGAEAESSEEEDADGEPDDDEEDVDMDEPAHPKPPKIVLKQTPKSGGKLSKPTLIVTPAPTGPLKGVEAKEADIDAEGDEAGDDEELSELESDEEEEQEDNGVGGDAEGEEEDMEEEEDADGDDVDIDIDSEGMTGSGAATPDLAKMTKRQRRDDEGFMALDMAPQIKKHFTQEEQNMRRSEMARRRKNLSEKKVMEEKESTINKLLKKQTSKRRGANAKPETLAAAVAAEGAENESPGEEAVEKPNPLYTRWISDRQGVRLGVPEEWLGKQVGRMFGPPKPMSSGKLIEEIQ